MKTWFSARQPWTSLCAEKKSKNVAVMLPWMLSKVIVFKLKSCGIYFRISVWWQGFTHPESVSLKFLLHLLGQKVILLVIMHINNKVLLKTNETEVTIIDHW